MHNDEINALKQAYYKEKNRNSFLSQENFGLKLDLATCKNKIEQLEAELSYSRKQNSAKLIKNPIFSLKHTHNNEIDSPSSPQTKVSFIPFRLPAHNIHDETPDAEPEFDHLFTNSNNKLIGKQIFEDFLIMGSNPDKTNLFSYKNENNNNNVLINENKPEILLNYAQNLTESEISTILSCAFPFGLKHEKLRTEEGFAELNEILLASNTLFQNRDKAFVFVIKSDINDKQGVAYQFKLDIFGGKSEFKKVSLLESSNPHHFKYCICYKVDDYVSIISKKQKKKKEESEYTFIKTQKILCFVTYYPFFKFFTDIIISILNYFKLNKLKLFNETETPDVLIYSKLDSRFLFNEMNKDLLKILSNISQIPLPCFESTILFPNFDNFSEMITFRIPNEKTSEMLEIDWISILMFKKIKTEDFLLILLSILLEKKVVLFARSLGLLTSTILTCLCAIRPFLWVHPIIMNLPENLLELLYSPVPIIVGINKDSEFIKLAKLDQKNPDCIFIVLESENKVFEAKKAEEDIFSQFFHLLSYKIHEKYSECENAKDDEIGKIGKEIVQIIRETINKEIVEYIPKQKGKGELDEMAEELGKSKDKFVRKFVKTQMFCYYLQKFYEK